MARVRILERALDVNARKREGLLTKYNERVYNKNEKVGRR